ncbi:LA_2272 family surface repeat-containing protein [Leptospira borgpetersenii]|uniref:LA_2272 family surface repeat-containing protein n=1 Tax=Leptospira borgpetersenii TaxID=174 RepID=UPI00390589BE
MGIVNISETHQKQFQIGIINYCPNNTFPIMIMANYCSKPKSETPFSTPKTGLETETGPTN